MGEAWIPAFAGMTDASPPRPAHSPMVIDNKAPPVPSLSRVFADPGFTCGIRHIHAPADEKKKENQSGPHQEQIEKHGMEALNVLE
jgi:hypothetical protein